MDPIREGASGAAVEDIQERLGRLGYEIDEFRERGLYVGTVVITQWTDDNKAAAEVKERFETLGSRVYRHFPMQRVNFRFSWES